MRLALVSCVLLALAAPAGAAPPKLSADECAVWRREQSFARALAAHDAEAFAAHVSEHAVFGAGDPEPTRGRDAIVERWAGLIEGRQVRLRWYPTRVSIAEGAKDLAWSSGPALFEMRDPKAASRYRIGAFRSVWRREPDGAWRVVFDAGEPPLPATAGQVAAFEAGEADCAPAD